MKILKLNDTLFNVEIFLVFHCTFDEFGVYLLKKHNVKIDQSDGQDDATTACFRHYVFIWLDDMPSTTTTTPELITALQHEIGHGVFYILGRAGVPIQTGDNEEMFLYLQSYYLQKMLTKIENSFKKIKKQCNIVKNKQQKNDVENNRLTKGEIKKK